MNAVVDFFQNLFSPIIGVLGAVLLYFHEMGLPWWLSIAVLTVIIRTLLFPLTIKQVRSMRAMQSLKPEMDRIRSKFQDNRQKQQEEMMKLYKERGINPLGGCFPILLQMPVFIGIFYVIRQFGGVPESAPGPAEPPLYESFRQGGILWFQDLSHMDPYYVLPILSAVTMLAATEITSKHVDPQQRWLMRLLPVVVTVFLWSFPAGLFVYWITSNLVTLAQNYVIYNLLPAKKESESNAQPSKPTQTASQNQHEAEHKQETAGNGDASPNTKKRAKRKRRKKKK